MATIPIPFSVNRDILENMVFTISGAQDVDIFANAADWPTTEFSNTSYHRPLTVQWGGIIMNVDGSPMFRPTYRTHNLVGYPIKTGTLVDGTAQPDTSKPLVNFFTENFNDPTPVVPDYPVENYAMWGTTGDHFCARHWNFPIKAKDLNGTYVFLGYCRAASGYNNVNAHLFYKNTNSDIVLSVHTVPKYRTSGQNSVSGNNDAGNRNADPTTYLHFFPRFLSMSYAYDNVFTDRWEPYYTFNGRTYDLSDPYDVIAGYCNGSGDPISPRNRYHVQNPNACVYKSSTRPGTAKNVNISSICTPLYDSENGVLITSSTGHRFWGVAPAAFKSVDGSPNVYELPTQSYYYSDYSLFDTAEGSSHEAFRPNDGIVSLLGSTLPFPSSLAGTSSTSATKAFDISVRVDMTQDNHL